MNNELSRAIDRLEKEILYLHSDYKLLLNRNQTFHEICMLRIKIKQAEESLRTKRKMLFVSAN